MKTELEQKLFQSAAQMVPTKKTYNEKTVIQEKKECEIMKILFEMPGRIDLQSEDYFLDARNVSEAELTEWLDSTRDSIQKIRQNIEPQGQEEFRKYIEARQKSCLPGFLHDLLHPIESVPALTIFPCIPSIILLCREEQLNLILRKGKDIPARQITAIVRTDSIPVSARKTPQEQTETAWKG